MEQWRTDSHKRCVEPQQNVGQGTWNATGIVKRQESKTWSSLLVMLSMILEFDTI